MNSKPKNQFSLTRGALSTTGPAKSNFLSVSVTKLSGLIITGLCAFLFGCAHTIHERPSAALQIRRVVETPSGDSEPMSIVSNETKEIVNVHKAVLLDETAVKSAGVRTDNLGRSAIEIIFSNEGRKRFAEITRENVGRRLAIIMEGQLYATPTIKTEISGGTAEINGNFSKDEANVLAAKIIQAIERH